MYLSMYLSMYVSMYVRLYVFFHHPAGPARLKVKIYKATHARNKMAVQIKWRTPRKLYKMDNFTDGTHAWGVHFHRMAS